jgi:hypothetical protein
MKNLRTLTLLATTVIVINLGLGACAPALSPVYEAPLGSSLPEAYKRLLPAGMETPERLPAKITDPLLLAAWVYLYNQVEPIEIHNDETTSGRQLALYALENNVPVEWGSDEICRGNSCSFRAMCEDEKCVTKYRSKKVNALYLSLRYHEATAEMLPNLAGSMGHELYHHQLPFGPVKTALYEEYWAYKIGGSISKADWATFEGYYPLDEASLVKWFDDHNWQGYTDRDVYPFTLKAEVNQALSVIDNK